MTQDEIINGSKLIAEYLGWIYIPFSADLKHKAGWWSKIPKTKEDRFYSKINGDSGYICRKHSELRFWNSLDALVPVIQKIEKDYNVVIWITYNGAEHTDFADKKWKTKICQSYDKDLQLSNNVFKVVVETLTECKTWKIED